MGKLMMGFVNYRNGNYVVYINTETGDKIRNTYDKEFKPAFAENCDVTITNRCDGNCAFCYAGCTEDGHHGDLNAAFLDTLHPFTELAINGNDLTHPDLSDFLRRMREKNVIVNMTVNQKHFEKHFTLIQMYQMTGLIHGVGVSLVQPTESFIKKVTQCKNTIIHVINGVVSSTDMEKLIGYNLDILILGYKTTGRGQVYLDKFNEMTSNRQEWMKENMQSIFNGFRTVEFDDLALEQLNIQSMLPEKVWNDHYMGDDGSFTFFINLVDGYFAMNSTSDAHYPLLDSVDEMFQHIQKMRKENAA